MTQDKYEAHAPKHAVGQRKAHQRTWRGKVIEYALRGAERLAALAGRVGRGVLREEALLQGRGYAGLRVHRHVVDAGKGLDRRLQPLHRIRRG